MRFGTAGPAIRRSPRPNVAPGQYGTPRIWSYDGAGRVVPIALPPGWHNVRARVPRRLASCDEVPHDLVDPALCREAHFLPAGPPLYLYDVHIGSDIITRTVTEDQFVDELHANVDAVIARAKLGSYD